MTLETRSGIFFVVPITFGGRLEHDNVADIDAPKGLGQLVNGDPLSFVEGRLQTFVRATRTSGAN